MIVMDFWRWFEVEQIELVGRVVDGKHAQQVTHEIRMWAGGPSFELRRRHGARKVLDVDRCEIAIELGEGG